MREDQMVVEVEVEVEAEVEEIHHQVEEGDQEEEEGEQMLQAAIHLLGTTDQTLILVEGDQSTWNYQEMGEHLMSILLLEGPNYLMDLHSPPPSPSLHNPKTPMST